MTPETELEELEQAQEQEADSGREQSTIVFPYDDLDAAITVAHGVHARGGRCAPDELAAELGYSGVANGAFRLRVATARIFGLIATARQNVELAAIGRRVVDPQQEAAARSDAFLAVPLYRRMYDDFRGTTLPPLPGIERRFAELGVSSKQTDKARQVFHRSAQQAGFFNSGTDRLVAPTTTPNEPTGLKGIVLGGKTNEGGGPPPPPELHPLITGLVKELPEPGTVWDEDGRAQWLATAKAVLGLIYKTAPRQISAPQPHGNGSALVEAGQSQ